jgi:stearoyl-CoA desaturase (delta-9 desaturase)
MCNTAVHWIGAVVAFALPAAIGYAWEAGYRRWARSSSAESLAWCVQHVTFCINSLGHYLGSQPWSSKCSARDSWLTALVTFGEGYHNYHHEFQNDYRNGVKPWQFDPTKWIIWTLSKVGLANHLRRARKILDASLAASIGEAGAKRLGGQPLESA